MDQSLQLAAVLVQATRQVAEALPRLRTSTDISHYTVEIHRLENDGDRTSANAAFVDAVAQANVTYAMASLLDQSPVLRDLIEAGTVGLVGAMYDVRTGHVTFLKAAGISADAAVEVSSVEDVRARPGASGTARPPRGRGRTDGTSGERGEPASVEEPVDADPRVA